MLATAATTTFIKPYWAEVSTKFGNFMSAREPRLSTKKKQLQDDNV